MAVESFPLLLQVVTKKLELLKTLQEKFKRKKERKNTAKLRERKSKTKQFLTKSKRFKKKCGQLRSVEENQSREVLRIKVDICDTVKRFLDSSDIVHSKLVS